MCSRGNCNSCSKVDECGWCSSTHAVAVGDCVAVSEAETSCSTALVTEGANCPSVGADVILKNITGMLGAMIGLAIILNVYNRISNRRRRRKLQHSIFGLPVYVYTASARERAAAARQARARAQGGRVTSSDQAPNTDVAPAASATSTSSASSSSSEDSDDASVVTCTVCLAAYEEQDVIKVLPCGHEFHSGCLDSWLEQKAACPLCMAPAFPKSGDQDRTSRGQASTRGLRQANAESPLSRSSHQAQRSQPGEAGSGDGIEGGLLVAGPASPSPPETSGEAPPEGAPETARGQELVATSPTMAVAMVSEVEEEGDGETEVRKAGAGLEEAATIRSARDNRPITSGAAIAPTGSFVVGTRSHAVVGEGASGAGAARAAGDDGTAGPAGLAHRPSEAAPCPYHSGNTAETARPCESLGRAGREMSLTELEKGQAEQAEAAIAVGAAVDAVGPVGAVADGGPAAGRDGVGGVSTGGGADIEGGGSGVDGNVYGPAAAFQA